MCAVSKEVYDNEHTHKNVKAIYVSTHNNMPIITALYLISRL